MKILIRELTMITITLEQAKEWDMEEERVLYICDTFGVYAHQYAIIEKIEKALGNLLDLESCNQEQGSILEHHGYTHNYNW